MGKTKINGRNIYFEESLGASDELVLCLHGNSLSSKYFTKLLDSDFGHAYKIIALDLPGHGSSDKFPNQYSIPNLLKALEEFIYTLNYSKIILVGHSLGGHLAIELLSTNVKNRIKGLFIFGTPPVSSSSDFSEAAHHTEALSCFFKENLSIFEEKLMSRCLFHEDFIIPEYLQNIISLTDPTVRSSLVQSVSTNEMLDEIEILKQSKISFRIYISENDVLINNHYLLKISKAYKWQRYLIFDSKSGHSPQIENPDLFNQSLKQFLIEISTSDQHLSNTLP